MDMDGWTWLSKKHSDVMPDFWMSNYTEIWTHQKLFHTEKPDPLSGKLTARPSGKFWIPIPMARFLKWRKHRWNSLKAKKENTCLYLMLCFGMYTKLEQLERLHSVDTSRHLMITHTIYWVILDPKSKEDKVKVTNLKNSPKFQIFEL